MKSRCALLCGLCVPGARVLQNDRVFDVIKGFNSTELRGAIERFWALRAAAVTTGTDLLSYLPPPTAPSEPSRRQSNARRRSLVVSALQRLATACDSVLSANRHVVAHSGMPLCLFQWWRCMFP